MTKTITGNKLNEKAKENGLVSYDGKLLVFGKEIRFEGSKVYTVFEEKLQDPDSWSDTYGDIHTTYNFVEDGHRITV